jgi:hypothetical protein
MIVKFPKIHIIITYLKEPEAYSMSSLLDNYINQLEKGQRGLGGLGGLSIKCVKGLCHEKYFFLMACTFISVLSVYALVVFILFLFFCIENKF